MYVQRQKRGGASLKTTKPTALNECTSSSSLLAMEQ